MDRRTSLSMLAVGLAAAGTSVAAAPQASGGIKFMVLYGHPPKPAEFEKYYLDVHMPLVFAMKGAAKWKRPSVYHRRTVRHPRSIESSKLGSTVPNTWPPFSARLKE
jgi:hypothetical protein